MKDDKRLLKVSRNLSIQLRQKVFVLYDGDTYGNLGKEVEEAISNHLVVLDTKIAKKTGSEKPASSEKLVVPVIAEVEPETGSEIPEKTPVEEKPVKKNKKKKD